jgi:hypothetical protein
VHSHTRRESCQRVHVRSSWFALAGAGSPHCSFRPCINAHFRRPLTSVVHSLPSSTHFRRPLTSVVHSLKNMLFRCAKGCSVLAEGCAPSACVGLATCWGHVLGCRHVMCVENRTKVDFIVLVFGTNGGKNHRHTDTPTHRHTDTPTHRHTDKPPHRHTNTPTHHRTNMSTHVGLRSRQPRWVTQPWWRMLAATLNGTYGRGRST